MNQRPNPHDESAVPEDPPPASDPEPAPRFPKRKRGQDARPETLADDVKVTPLDEDKNIEGGIEVKET